VTDDLIVDPAERGSDVSQFQARPTVYKGIEMRSRMEAGFAAWLDQRHFDWKYEPDCFAGPKGQYLPDFGLYGVDCQWLEAPATVYVETKPLGWSEREGEFDDYETLMRRMAIVWQSQPDAVLLLAQPPERTAGPMPAEVGLLDPDTSPANDPAFPWPVTAYWSLGIGGRVGLSRVLYTNVGPWYGEWWKGS
jgi:hypothetical protein